jgi:lipid-A-disaccharide synthase
MQAAGCTAWAQSHELAVMGLVEPLMHLPRLWRLRRRLITQFQVAAPHVFVGIDAPDFNLGLAGRLKAAGLATVQYVSPQVWAWRQGRVRHIARACDLVLCLLPFEAQFYAEHGVRAQFVGHPLADQIPLEVDREGARAALGIAPAATLIALLPGSRLGEVQRLGADFLGAARFILERRSTAQFIAPMASPAVREVFSRQLQAAGLAERVRVIEVDAQRVLAAADVVLVASGTATLETLLSKRQMVAAYRFAALTAFTARKLRLVKVPFFSHPNLLLGRRAIPEFLQEQVSGPALGAAVLAELDDHERRGELERAFRAVHEQLRCGGAERTAEAVLALVREKGA